MSESITSAFSEASEKISSAFSDTYKVVFIVLVIFLFLAINHIIIYSLYQKIKNMIDQYCKNKIAKK
jgi:5-bromo-4-chloroindolyl phosphate hydrolysis protein